MFTLIGRDVRDRGEDICRISTSPFNAISVIDSAIAGLSIYIKVLQVIVEVHRSSTQISSQKCGVGCKNGGHIDPSLLSQGKGYASQPLVKVCNNRFLLLMGNELSHSQQAPQAGKGAVTMQAYLPEKPSYEVSKNNSLVRLRVSRR